VEWSGQPRRAGPAPSAAAALSKIVAQMTASSVQERHPQRRRRGLFVETRPPTRPQPQRGDIKALVAGDAAPDGAGKPIWDAGGYKDAAPDGAWAAANGQRAPKMPSRGARVFCWLRGATKIALLRSGAVHAAGQTTKAERCCVASHQAHQGPCHARASAVRRGIVVEGRGPTGGQLRSGAAYRGAKKSSPHAQVYLAPTGFLEGPRRGPGTAAAAVPVAVQH
jgi:hypothetical protein